MATSPGGKKCHTSFPSVTLGQTVSPPSWRAVQAAVPTACSPASRGHMVSGPHTVQTWGWALSREGSGACTSSSLSLCDPSAGTRQGALVLGQHRVPRLLSPSFWEPSSFSLPPSLPLRPWT